MGQYYHAVVLDPQKDNTTIVAAYNPNNYGNGAKLREHSWMENNFVQTVESQFLPGRTHYKHSLVWAGDYADHEPGTEDDLYDLSETKIVKARERAVDAKFRYLVNHSQQVFLDKIKQKKDDTMWGWLPHPLPLLTCEGNGRGGGDYFSENAEVMKHVGSWARDIISVESDVPPGYEEIMVSF